MQVLGGMGHVERVGGLDGNGVGMDGVLAWYVVSLVSSLWCAAWHGVRSDCDARNCVCVPA